MEDFRPPKELRRGRQNIQKQINNPFMQFLRWSCKKLLDSPNHSVLSLVVPLSFWKQNHINMLENICVKIFLMYGLYL